MHLHYLEVLVLVQYESHTTHHIYTEWMWINEFLVRKDVLGENSKIDRAHVPMRQWYVTYLCTIWKVLIATRLGNLMHVVV
jgi:hypothetical protein